MKFTALILILTVIASLAHARPTVLNDKLTVDTGGTIEIAGGKLTLDEVEVTASAAELNLVDGVTATTAELNAAADASARATTASITNGAVLTLSAATPVVALTGIGQADNYTNTFTIATPYPIGVDFTLYVTAASSNLLLLADSTTVLALGSDWEADGTDTLKFYTIATNSAVKISSSDN